MKRTFYIVGGFAIMIAFAFKSSAISREPLDWFKQELLARINTLRQKGCKCGSIYMPPAEPLTWNTELETAAYWHAKDMSANKYFSHTSLDGRKLKERVTAVGYEFYGYKSYSIGENIAQGQRSIKEVVNAWLKSEGHCKNLMNPAFKEVGIVTVGNYYWVQDFGGREPFVAEAAK